jgi:hypothetical protein
MENVSIGSRPFPPVVAGLVPAIHVFAAVKTWVPGTSPGMTLSLIGCVFAALSLRPPVKPGAGSLPASGAR